MQYEKLRVELLTDPVTLGLVGLSDQLAADKLNAVDTGRTLKRRDISKNELLTAIVDSEWPTTVILQNKLLCIFSCDTIDASDARVKAICAAIFGAPTATRANLLVLGSKVVSRATELGFEFVTELDVKLARSGVW